MSSLGQSSVIKRKNKEDLALRQGRC